MNAAYGVYNRYNPVPRSASRWGFRPVKTVCTTAAAMKMTVIFDNRAYAFDSAVSFQATDRLTVTAMSGVLYEDSACLV